MTAVVGAGAVSAFGRGVQPLLEGVFAGERGLRPLRRLAGVPCETQVAGELPDGLPTGPLELARLAAEEALADESPRGMGLVLASTKADLRGVEGQGEGLGCPWRLARALASGLACDGPLVAVSTACSSGLSALALAGRWIAAGRATRVLVVGVDVLTPFVLRGFSSLLALDPGPCRPYDRMRRGLSLGEGAAAILLSAEPANGDARLVGWGESNDANHVTGPSRDGAGLALAVTRALRRADAAPDAVDLIHLHGTGTRYNDASEALALERVFEGTTPPALGTKGQTGHTLGAAGLLESLVAIECLRRREVPANVGLEEPDVAPALRLTRERTTLSSARTALKVSAGFGGINAAVLWRLP